MGDNIAGGAGFWMDDGMDTGPIESQDFCFVSPADSPMDLWKRELGPHGREAIDRGDPPPCPGRATPAQAPRRGIRHLRAAGSGNVQ